MLYTYIRWYGGTRYAERKNKEDADDENSFRHEEAKTVIEQIDTIKLHRHWGQPYVGFITQREIFWCLLCLDQVGVVRIHYVYDCSTREQLVRSFPYQSKPVG